MLGCIPAAYAQDTDSSSAGGSGLSAAEEMARKLQNPLANMKAIMTDNSVGFDTGDDGGTSYGFQVQPVYAMDMPDRGFTLIPRAVIPFLGLEPGADIPIVEDTVGQASSEVWGLGDSMLQLFYAPHIDSSWKWGIGPQLSLKTRTDERLAGADWGAGLSVIVTGALTDDISFAGFIGNHWSYDGDFNLGSFQPTVAYNIASLPGAAISYNATTTVDWTTSSSNAWTLPLGLSFGKTFEISGGKGLDLSAGPYYNVIRPEGAAGWMLRFGVTVIFP